MYRLMLVLVSVVEVACFSPRLEACAVSCNEVTPCPGDLTCGADLYCHESAEAVACRTLAVVKSGDGTGTVASEPGLSCGNTCTRTVLDGTAVTLTAVADGGSRFAGWTGPCAGREPCSITLRSNEEVAARFSLLTQRLEVEFIGAGIGRVTSAPAGIDCTTGGTTCAGLFALDTVVELSATPDPAVNFVGWQGACEGTSTCVVTLSASTQVIADFE